MKYIDLFGGAGGFSLGIKRAYDNKHESKKWRSKKRRNRNFDEQRYSFLPSDNPPLCVGYYEWDKYAVQTYNKNFGTSYEPTDITKFHERDIPDHDLLCAGFPCQSFSIAGKRKGFEDTRGTMFFEICRIIKHKQPSLLLLENVKGLLSHDEGKTMGKILKSLSELGYDCQWQVFNSKHFGVPQNRERVFIIGYIRGLPRPKIFPFGENAGEVQGIPGNKAMENKQEGRIMFDVYNKALRNLVMEDIEEALAQDGYELTDKGRKSLILTLERKDWRKHQEEGTTPTLKQRMGTERNNVPMVLGMLPITAKKRAFDTPKEINQFLKDNKGNFSIKKIAKALGIPKTQAEHYFRIDKSRAVPSPELWLKLKELLGFDDSFDKQVTEVYEKEVEYEMNRRVYSGEGQSPTLKTDVPMVMSLFPRSSKTGKGGTGTLCKENEAFCVDTGNMQGVHTGRLRKLTPVECERLQGFPDGWTEGVSDTQRYKMMGNAVTVNVIQAIMEKLIEMKEQGDDEK